MANVNETLSCRNALEGVHVAVNCAGPFFDASLALPQACLEVGCHYVDIAEDRAWCRRIRALNGEFRARSLTAAFGCSSVPGISSALALVARENIETVEKARVTLFLGNANPKGKAAVRSMAAQMGTAFRDSEVVSLPPPFGRRRVFNFESADADEMPKLVGARRVAIRVGFEIGLATRLFGVASRLGPAWSEKLTRLLAGVGSLLRWVGHSGGVVQVELFRPDGSAVRASVSHGRDGQRMAALPAAFVAEALYRKETGITGAVQAHDVLGARALLERLAAAGYSLSLPEA